jgi:hypothetical protein
MWPQKFHVLDELLVHFAKFVCGWYLERGHWSLGWAKKENPSNPSYLGGWDQEDLVLRPAYANSLQDYISKISRTGSVVEHLHGIHEALNSVPSNTKLKNRTKWTGGVVQVQIATALQAWSPKFKPPSNQKKEERKEKEERLKTDAYSVSHVTTSTVLWWYSLKASPDTSTQNCELNKPLFFINYPISSIL